MQDEIAAAVAAAVAYNPAQPQLQGEAYAFLNRVKTEPEQTWESCLDIFLAGDGSSSAWRYKFAPEARMFGLQVVDEILSTRFEALDSNKVIAIQAGLLEYVKREYTQGDAEGQLICQLDSLKAIVYPSAADDVNADLRNKVTHTLFLLFMQSYTSTWPNFFPSFFGLLQSSNSSTEPFNPKVADLLLRLLHELSVEISDTTLRLNKAHARLVRDTELRDAVRAKDAPQIAETIVKVLSWALGHIDSPTSVLSSQNAVEIAAMAMNVLADFAPWIDIGLIVTNTLMPLLYQCLAVPHVTIRLASADLLYELVTKGMPVTDKLELLRMLNVSDIIKQLLNADDQRKSSATNGHSNDEQQEVFREKLARVLNGLGLELTRLLEEASATDEQKEVAKAAALAQRPLALRFLADEYDDTSSTVIPFIQSIMTLYKRERKRDQAGHLTPEKGEFLRALLDTTMTKMRYGSEEEWGGDEDEDDGEDEVVTAFLEFRKNLKTVYDAVAWIDFRLFGKSVQDLLVRTLDKVDAGGQGLSWNDVEVAVYVMYLYGEPAAKETGASGVAAFLQIPPEDLKKLKSNPNANLDYSKYTASTLGEMMMRLLQSRVSSWPHPSVPMQFFECVSRYHDFFHLAPDTIQAVLPAFLDERGIHQQQQSIRSRCFYLFNRFINTSRHQLQEHVTVDAVTSVCSQVEDLLVIEASVPASESPGEDVLGKAANKGSPFDSQLYLFEAIGTLISLLSNSPDQQVQLLQALLQPLLRDIQAISSRPNNDPSSLLELHHLIKACGSIAYGFPDLKNTPTAPDGKWVAVLREAMRIIIVSLKAQNQVAVLREASLGAFKSVMARIGDAALPLVEPLVECLVDQLTAPETVDFLPFIGMLTHRFKTSSAQMLDALLAPVFDRAYFFLEQPITGTDDILQHSELRRAYFGLLMSICNAGMHDVFFSERNMPRLEHLLNSIPHYLSNGALLLDQRAGFAVVNKLILEWVKPVSSTEQSRLPQFKDFVYERIVKLSLELPVRQAFDYSDAQAYQVIGEIAALHKQLQTLREAEYLTFLTTSVFPSFGIPQDTADAFIGNLVQASDSRAFKKWLAPFFQKAKQTSNDKPYSVAHLLTVVPGAVQA